ncbi:hypothetical protein [Accumulibacter sp.]|uniref:hypothetical protein n=1 Tax=Accumulibacter sp. TaxID=2053492 RepID=UPI00257A1DF0|nr:hypothetical protein [Accumulibacter sp.]
MPDRQLPGNGTPLPNHDHGGPLLAMVHELPLECEVRRMSPPVAPDVADGALPRSGRDEVSLNETRRAANDRR